ncbi:MAG: acyltransferase family protein [Isosphaeraceae bacterium]
MRRIEELDSLRGLAALAIVLFHLPAGSSSPLGSSIYLFFVLSGYLITSILLRQPTNGGFLVAFYARRGLRIWPIYYLALCGVILLNVWAPNPASLASLARYLTFTQFTGYYWSASVTDAIPALGHTWSLAVEEQFYLLWPAVLALAGRRRLAGAAMLIIAVAVATRALGYSRWILATNCDGLALGGLLAAMLHDRSPSEARSLYGTRLTAAGLLAGTAWAVAHLPGPWGTVLAPTRILCVNIVFVAVVGLVVIHAGDPRLALLRDRRLVYLGTISYGLYLYHYILYHWLEDWVAAPVTSEAVRDALKVVASVLAAALSERWIERPIGSLKRFFPYPNGGPPDPAPTGPHLSRILLPLARPEEA